MPGGVPQPRGNLTQSLLFLRSLNYLPTTSLLLAGVWRNVQTSKNIEMMTVATKTRRKLVRIENIFMVPQVMPGVTSLWLASGFRLQRLTDSVSVLSLDHLTPDLILKAETELCFWTT